ncbi:helix-turn-helix transcriptional regulator [Alkalihalobacillus trypoxylicola]|uniref:HTH cro/C1-type domain-containing protein n=1 Tax=Alkalihalobacillus trypoxylicola TaxID=519424 RepID=A0A161PHC8_9BACI|nr:helix-turn-helix domain-containing protein [Alkalihalobacillus trypoxylicola]KYG28193.1 hypothetical protein AZF04_09835 [Alkalihalobacillus trypoxylicola]
METELKVILARRDDMNQKILAERVGLTTAAINKIVNGNDPKLSTALKIAKELDMNVHDIWKL